LTWSFSLFAGAIGAYLGEQRVLRPMARFAQVTGALVNVSQADVRDHL
jgi:hypothetical protein